MTSLDHLSIDDRVAISCHDPSFYELVIRAKDSGKYTGLTQASSLGPGQRVADLLWALDIETIYQIGRSAHFTQQADTADSMHEKLRLYTQGAEINPYNEVAAVSAGVAMSELGRNGDAIRWLENVLEKLPSSQRARSNLDAIRAELV